MPKAKTHKALLKRVRISKTGKVKHNKAGCKHLRSSKSPKRLSRLRGGSIVSTPDAKRLGKILFMRLRGRDQPRSAIRRSPSPAQRRAARAAAKAAAATV
jgi:large subunit ribosomal protein L35